MTLSKAFCYENSEVADIRETLSEERLKDKETHKAIENFQRNMQLMKNCIDGPFHGTSVVCEKVICLQKRYRH